MKLLVAGATGAVGGHVVRQALQRGHEVIAIARSSESLTIEHVRLTKHSADILAPGTIRPLLEGVDVVLSTVGIGASKAPTRLYSTGTHNLVAAMNEHGVQRIIVISSEVADHWAHQSALKRWVVLPLLQRILGATYDDMRRMDRVLWESAAQWTVIRAPRIRRTVAKGAYRLSVEAPLSRAWSITAPDMATAMLDVAERDDLNRRYVTVAN